MKSLTCKDDLVKQVCEVYNSQTPYYEIIDKVIKIIKEAKEVAAIDETGKGGIGMSIYLGNLTVKQMEDRLGIELTDDERAEMESFHCLKADVEKGEWHCFDIPFEIHCGDREAGSRIYKILSPYSSKMKCQLPVRLSC